MPKGDRVEAAFSFDTTGSMSPCIGQVRRRVEDSLTKLFKEVPGIRIAVGAHGDYCDKGDSYVTKWADLTPDINKVCRFVRDVGNTGGGDLPECYELMLNEARGLNWSVNARKVFVLIGDDVPHPPSYPGNTKRLDWRKEAAELAKLGVTVHAVQCLSKGGYADSFYEEVAGITGGVHLRLDQFSEITDLVMAVCYQQAGPEQLAQFENELAKSGRMSRSLDSNLGRLAGRKTSNRFKSLDKGLEPVPAGRFQILEVDGDAMISEFVEGNGIPFKRGRGFYEFTKKETIQENKEVVLRDKATGDMFTGPKARVMIGVPLGVRDRVKPTLLEKYDVFIQSTSYNRTLKGGTRFLYEVDLSR